MPRREGKGLGAATFEMMTRKLLAYCVSLDGVVDAQKHIYNHICLFGMNTSGFTRGQIESAHTSDQARKIDVRNFRTRNLRCTTTNSVLK